MMVARALIPMFGFAFLLMLVVLIVALVASRRAAQQEAAADLPGRELAPPGAMEVHRLRVSGRDGLQVVRVYATTLDEASVDRFYADALTALGYRRIAGRSVHEPSGQVTLGEFGRGDVRYTVSVSQTPHVIAGHRVTSDWSLVIYAQIEFGGGEVVGVEEGDLASQVGAQVTLRGKALDAKAGAVLQTHGAMIYLEGVRAWDKAERGRTVIVTGILQRRVHIPEAIAVDGGLHSAGARGPRWVLESPVHRLVD